MIQCFYHKAETVSFFGYFSVLPPISVLVLLSVVGIYFNIETSHLATFGSACTTRMYASFSTSVG
jgi:hypothetical protein